MKVTSHRLIFDFGENQKVLFVINLSEVIQLTEKVTKL